MNINNLFGKIISRNAVIEEIKPAGKIEEIFDYFKDTRNCNLLLNGTNQHFSRYSYFGYDPFLVFKSKGDRINITKNGKRYSFKDNPFNILKKIILTYKIANCPDTLDFISGGIGYLSYDLCRFTEKLPGKAIDDMNMPDCYFVFYKLLYIYDRTSDKSWISSVDFLETDSRKAAKNARVGIKRFRNILDVKNKRKRTVSAKNIKPSDKMNSNFKKRDYLKAVRKSISYIYAGDIYQVNLSQRFNIKYRNHPYELFKKLCRVNPAPFACYLNSGNFHIVGSSPERFLKARNGAVHTRPMKGTRPRGKNESDDNLLSKELLTSPKDEAELSMIVDLERNDLGKTCEFGSVRVEEHKNLEIYSTVFQMTSTVSGKLKKKYDCIDLLKSCFPGGSITGCPKIRAMEIIDELEPTKRNVYTGSIGWIGFNDSMDLNIVIRTIILKNENAFFQVGGGIVADSDPENEYRETLDKAKALVIALK